MALSAIIRLATPTAARFLVSVNHTRKIISHDSFLVPSRRSYSASPAPSPPSSDESLLRVIESEISCSEKNFEAGEGLPEGFPFQVCDNLGQQTLSLTREFHGETINMEVETSRFITGEDDATGNHIPSRLAMVVEVSKAGVPSLEFGITINAEKIVIESLTIRNSEMPEDQIPYEGPMFYELDENLQKAFYKYLETRGITPGGTKFLHKYMLSKDHKEYSNWLKNLKKIVEA